MELRKEIEPDFDTAEKCYAEVLKLILEYTNIARSMEIKTMLNI